MNAIGIKEKDRVVLGIDSIAYTAHSTSYVPANMPIFKPRKAPYTWVCYTGYGLIRDLIVTQDNLIDESKLIDGKLTCDYVMNHTFPLIRELHYKFKITKEDEELDDIGGCLLMAKGTDLIGLDPFGNIRKIKDYRAMGRKADFLQAILDSTSKYQDSIYRILKAFLIYSETGLTVFPICISDTKTNKVTTYSLEQTVEYVNNFERKEEI